MNNRVWIIILTLTSLSGIVCAGVLFYQNTLNEERFESLLQITEQREASLVGRVKAAQQELSDTIAILDLNEAEKLQLQEDLEEKKEKLDDAERELNKTARRVDDLVKLANTDEELLQKYSKVYFLNENYVPSSLRDIDEEYLVGTKQLQIHGEALPFLDDLMQDAIDDGLSLRVNSAYRSFEYQRQIKERFLIQYGSGANEFSADQGFSEHQLGTAIDFTTPTLVGPVDAFEFTPEYQWLQDNAYKYGFILSYPKNNSYYQFEPWHWRFVGKDLAKYLHKNDLSFYDMDQREINEYLLEIFD